MISSRQMMQRTMKRRRFKQEKSFEDRLKDEAERFKEAATRTPPGTARELLLKRVRQCETALDISDRLKSSGQQPPTKL